MFVIQDLLVDKLFLQLDRQLNAFNVFDVLNLREYEIRHTRFLAHMLDPCGTHGLGNTFLRNFLLQVGAQLASGERGGLLDEVHSLDLDLARVVAEISLTTNMEDDMVDIYEAQATSKHKSGSSSGRLDILLQIPRRDGTDIAIAIENKINAKESNGQLARYKNWVNTRFTNTMLLYLTVNEEEVDHAWNCITYSNVVYPALELTRRSSSNPSPDVALMISHYMAVLRDKVEAEAANADADSIAQELHRTYPAAKAAIDALQSEWKGPISGQRLDSNWGLYNRYKAAFKFLSRYHKDELSRALQWFTSTWPKMVGATLPEAPRIVIDDSNRSYMRFLPIPAGSTLKELSRQYAQKVGSNGQYAWTSGVNSVLFELRSYAVQQPGKDQDNASEFGWNLFLVIGPLDGIDRIAFVNRLRGLLRDELKKNPPPPDSDLLPVIRQGKVSAIFFSVLKWKLSAKNVQELEKVLMSPQFLSSLEQISRLLELALQAEETKV